VKKRRNPDEQIARALIGQVASTAAAKGYSERQVTTLITKPMWKAFLRGLGEDDNLKPTEWIGEDTIRVYGSKTILINSRKMFSVSFSEPKE
jgi:hypothetical protein